MKQIASMIHSYRTSLVESAAETFLTSSWSYDLTLPQATMKKIFGGIFLSLERDLTQESATELGHHLIQFYLKTLRNHPTLKQNFHAQLTIMGIARVVANHFLTFMPTSEINNFQEKFGIVQKIFDFTLIAISQWWGLLYDELRKGDQALINELKIVKNGLQHHLNIIYQIIRETPVGVVACDANLIVQHWNPMAVRLTGLTPMKILKKTVLDIFTNKSRDQFMQKLRSDRNWIPNLRLYIQPKNGNPVPVLVSISKIRNVHPGNIFYIINFQDVSDQAGFKSHVQRLNQLIAIARLSSSMMHDIRNPLNSIGLNIELLEQLFGKEGIDLSPDIQGLMNRVHQEIQQLSQNLNQYLSYSQLAQLQIEPLNLALQLATLIEELKFEAAFKNIQIIFQPIRKDCRIMGDWLQLRRVFINLIQNAVEVLQKGGEIRIKIYRRRKRVIINIKDNGPGIVLNRKGSVFEPFYTTKKSGTGLGLFIAREIVLAHRGRISYRSESGKGTQFTVSIAVFETNGEK